VQYGIDHGPCLSAMRTGEEIRVDELETDDRWRKYKPRALALGARSSLSIPLIAGDRSVGALNLYSREPRFFGEQNTRAAERFAQQASVAVAIAAQLATRAVLTDQLRASLASRSVIDQALGVIMAQQQCTAEEAFAILRRASQNRNIKVRQVAGGIVTGVSRKPPQPPRFDPPG
jgi:GAF domain-containing protein